MVEMQKPGYIISAGNMKYLISKYKSFKLLKIEGLSYAQAPRPKKYGIFRFLICHIDARH